MTNTADYNNTFEESLNYIVVALAAYTIFSSLETLF